MKNILAVMLGTLLVLSGCTQGTPGGPGASGPPSDRAIVGQTDETFSLSVPMMSTKVNQGDTTAVSIGIKRGTNMDGDVALMFEGLPKGLSVAPTGSAIKRGETEAKLTLKAADDASLGDFTIKVMGRPTQGADATVDLKVSVAKNPTVQAENAEAEAAKAERDEYARETRKLLDELDAKYKELEARRADLTEGQAKRDLEARLAQAKEKRELAAQRLDELDDASADRWEKIKEGVDGALTELKGIFS